MRYTLLYGPEDMPKALSFIAQGSGLSGLREAQRRRGGQRFLCPP
jgi:hypothetical protein